MKSTLIFETELIKRYNIIRTQQFEIDVCKICGNFISVNTNCQHKRRKLSTVKIVAKQEILMSKLQT